MKPVEFAELVQQWWKARWPRSTQTWGDEYLREMFYAHCPIRSIGDDVVEAAVKRVAQTFKTPPIPEEFRRLLYKVHGELHPRSKQTNEGYDRNCPYCYGMGHIAFWAVRECDRWLVETVVPREQWPKPEDKRRWCRGIVACNCGPLPRKEILDAGEIRSVVMAAVDVKAGAGAAQRKADANLDDDVPF